MKKLNLKINLVALVIVLSLPVFGIGLIAYMFLQDILGGGVSLWNCLAALLILSAPIILILNFLNEVTVVFDESGITKRYLFWRKYVDWENIVQVDITNLADNIWKINFVTPQDKISINAFFFKNLNELIKFIENKLPKEIIFNRN